MLKLAIQIWWLVLGLVATSIYITGLRVEVLESAPIGGWRLALDARVLVNSAKERKKKAT
ncbi:MAG: hypothetical protein CL675_13155 [Bdellovibrionaceae bacterium]|nr:hypothetical protein [Pseudobdellovibrionaceae bacterium]